MTITQLEYLVALDTHRHFGRAAEACGVSQPTLSMGISKLEEELGDTLFDRSRKPVLPTDLGERILSRARRVVQEFDLVRSEANREDGEATGQLEVGVLHAVAPDLLPLLVGPFARDYPAIDLTLGQLTAGEIASRLQRDHLHAGIVTSIDGMEEFDLTPLFVEAYYCYLSPDHELLREQVVRAEQIDPDSLWVPSADPDLPVRLNELLGRAARFDSPVRSVHLSGSDRETIVQIVGAGNGMTLVPALTTYYMSGPERRLLRPLSENHLQRTTYLATSRSALKREQIEAFVGTLRGAIHQVAELEDGVWLAEGPA